MDGFLTLLFFAVLFYVMMLAVSFTLCVLFDLLFPEAAMFQAWLKLLPGFEWLSWRSFILGLVESYGYDWYITLIWVPIYNFVAARQVKAHSPAQ